MEWKRIVLLFAVACLVFAAAWSVFMDRKKSLPESPETIVSDSAEKTASLGEVFALHRGESMRIKGSDVSLRVDGFVNSPCPKGSQCVWSGLAVQYTLFAGGKVYEAPRGQLSADAPFVVRVWDTDYETFAAFVIDHKTVSDTDSSTP